jgi:hypothetical protein
VFVPKLEIIILYCFFFFFFFFFFPIKTHQSEVKKRRKGKRPGLEPDGCGEG